MATFNGLTVEDRGTGGIVLSGTATSVSDDDVIGPFEVPDKFRVERMDTELQSGSASEHLTRVTRTPTVVDDEKGLLVKDDAAAVWLSTSFEAACYAPDKKIWLQFYVDTGSDNTIWFELLISPNFDA